MTTMGAPDDGSPWNSGGKPTRLLRGGSYLGRGAAPPSSSTSRPTTVTSTSAFRVSWFPHQSRLPLACQALINRL